MSTPTVRQSSSVELSADGPIARVVINRPSARNALDHATTKALRKAVEDAMDDVTVRCVVLAGAPGAFCAGADLKQVAVHLDGDPTDWFTQTVDDLHAVIQSLHAGPKPVVTAIGGPVAGGGLGLALAGDLRVASTDASFRSAYLRIGLSPDGASTYFFDRLLGLAETQRFMLLDEPLTAEQAAAKGLVHKVVSPGALEAESMAMAERLTRLSRESLAAARRLIAGAHRRSLEDQMDHEREALLGVAGSQDAKEGIRAFLEKRTPNFE